MEITSCDIGADPSYMVCFVGTAEPDFNLFLHWL